MTTMTAVAATAGQWTLAHTSSGGSIQVINNSPTVPLMVRAGDATSVTDTDATTLGNMMVHPGGKESLPGLAPGDIVLIRPVGDDAGKATIRTMFDLNAMGGEYETVAASATAQVLGATGAAGDYISHIIVVPTTTSPQSITLLDGATSIVVFAGGASSLTSLIPFSIPLGKKSVGGAWKLTTGTGLSCIAVGNFS